MALIEHGLHRKQKIRGDTQTYREQGDLIGFLDISWTAQKTKKSKRVTQTARWTHKPPFIFT
jgi:hypothetical protein